MEFSVKYRNALGEIVEIQFSALNRQDLFKQLSVANITAISVRDGDMVTKSSTPSYKRRYAFRGGVALFIIAIVGGLVLWFLHPALSIAPKPEEVKANSIDLAPPERISKSAKPQTKQVDTAKAERIGKLKAMTPAERMQFLFEEAAAKPFDMTPISNRVFRTGTEQIISWIFNTRLGDAPPILPMIPLVDEAHLAQILSAPNPALDGDGEKVREAKAMVEIAKKELIAYLQNGGKVEDFLEYYRGELVQAHNEWKESQKSVMQIIREEPDIAMEYITEINARLGEKGIKPVVIPPNIKKKLCIDE